MPMHMSDSFRVVRCSSGLSDTWIPGQRAAHWTPTGSVRHNSDGGVRGVLSDRRCPEASGESVSGEVRGRPRRVVLRPAGNAAAATRRSTAVRGRRREGPPLEVVGVEMSDGGLRVIHAMAMRASYEDLYEEAKRWLQ